MLNGLSFPGSSWQELQPSELIQMDDVEPILYTNNTSTFLCRAVAFLFADDLKFSIEFKNKTQKFLQGNNYTKRFTFEYSLIYLSIFCRVFI